MMIKVIRDNIFNSKAQTLVNPVNCIGIMGKGLALEFKIRFPNMFKDYVLKCKKNEIKIGKPYLFKSNISFPYILLFPTKKDYRLPSKLSYIEEGLKYIKLNYKNMGITSLAFPKLGCGLGKLNWEMVEPIFYSYMEDINIPVYLYK